MTSIAELLKWAPDLPADTIKRLDLLRHKYLLLAHETAHKHFGPNAQPLTRSQRDDIFGTIGIFTDELYRAIAAQYYECSALELIQDVNAFLEQLAGELLTD